MKLVMKRGMFTAIAACVLPVITHAETAAGNATASSEDSLSEVVVTAERRSESILKVPLAVSAITQADLASVGITNSGELSDLVPTLQANSAFGAVQPNFSIRGIGVNNEHNPNQASPVGVYIDDAYIAARVSQGLQIFDLERIEILRGPQGTLYGRNTTGGAINFISRQPSLNGSGGNVEVGYGNYNTFTAQGAYETTLVDGVAGLRTSFSYSHGDGWNKNVFTSQPAANSTDTAAGRLIFRVEPDDDLDVMLKVTAGRSNPTQAGVYDLGTGAPGQPADYNPVLAYSRSARGLSFWQIDSDRVGYNTIKNFGTELVAKYRLNEQLSLYSLTSYDYANANFQQEGTGVSSAAFEQPLDTLYGNKFTMINQEIRLSYLAPQTKVQAGLYYGYDKDESDSYYWLLDGGADFHQFFNQVRKSYAAFAQWDQAVTSALSVTLGARFTKDENSYGDYYSYLEPGAVSFTGRRDTASQYWDPSQGVYFLGSGFNSATGSIVPGPTVHLNSSAPTWRAAVDYTFDNGQLLYLSFNRGYRGAAFCGQCFANATLDTTRPETANAYELGTKGAYFGRKLTVSADVFWIDYRNQQTNEQIGLQSILTNVPKSRMRGFELEAQAQPTSDLRATLSLGVLDAKYEELTLSLATVNGLSEPYAPKVTGNFRFDWRLAHVAEGDVTFTPSINYTSKVFYSPYNTLDGNGPLSQGANTKINAQLAYRSSGRFVRLWVKNLTNKETFGDGLDLRTFGYYYLVQAPPRTWGFSAGMEF
jgi:iron complex outermembrane receptor protein